MTTPTQPDKATPSALSVKIVEALDKAARLHHWPERAVVKSLNAEIIDEHLKPILNEHAALQAVAEAVPSLMAIIETNLKPAQFIGYEYAKTALANLDAVRNGGGM